MRPPRPLLSSILLPSALLTLFAAQAFTSLRRKSVTVDEITYIAGGYYHLRTGRFDFNPTNPPLMKVLCGLPLLFLDPTLPPLEGDPSTWNEIRQWQYAREFLYSNRVDADTMLLAARLPVLGLGVLLGLAVFLWARRLYGPKAAAVALFLYSFCPNVLAHTRLATQDLGVTFFVLLAVGSLWVFLRAPSARRLLACGLAFAGAALSKTSAIVLAPITLLYVLFVVLRSREAGTWARLPLVKRVPPDRARVRQVLSIALSGLGLAGIALLGIHAGFGFEGSFEPLSKIVPPDRLADRLSISSPPLRSLLSSLLELPSPLPTPFLRIFRFQATRVAQGNSLYLCGELSQTGWWHMMPFAFLVKSPLPFLLLTGFALWGFLRRRAASSGEGLLLLSAAVVLALFTALRSVGVGLRYVLPMLPFLHVFASRSFRDGVDPPRWRRLAVGGLLLWQVVGTLRIHPDYLAHFNEIVGGPSNGFRVLADSNLDWGQDLKGLKEYMDRNEIPRIRLAYFGSADARYYGIDYEYLPSVGLAPKEPGERWWYEASDLPPLDLSRGPIAVSATLLVGIFYPGYYAPLLEREPSAQIGHSILIYDAD